MRRMKLFILLALSTLIVGAQSSYQWAKRAGGYAFDYGHGIQTDNSGNIYVVGEFEYKGNWGSIYKKGIGLHDVFLAKYSPSGNPVWVQIGGGWEGDAGFAVAVDGSGNVAITGEFEGSSTRFSGKYLKGHGTINDVFIAKYSSGGSLLWIKEAGGWSNDKGKGIACDNAGNVYVTGIFEGTMNFEGKKIYSRGGKDAFIAKYSSGGTLQWVKNIGSSGTDDGKSICVDNMGRVYVTGLFSGSLNAGGLSTTGKYDMFLICYDSGGNLLWAKKGGGKYYDQGRSVIYNENTGLVYVGGDFQYKGYFNGTTIQSSGGSDLFIAAYTRSGSLVWAKKAGGGGGDDEGKSITVDPYNNIYMTGFFRGTANFGSTSISSRGGTDIFVASFTSSGNPRWAMKAGGGSDKESGLGVTANSSGVYVSGNFYGKAYFGGTSLGSWGHSEAFVLKASIGSSSKFAPEGTSGESPVVSAGPQKMFPNPSTGDFVLEIKNAGGPVKILNETGQVVYSKEIPASDDVGRYNFSLKGILPAGVYFICYEEDGILKTERMMITR